MNIYFPIAANNHQVSQFANLLVKDERQKRKSLTWHTSLASAASYKLNQIINTNEFGHVINGVWPNAIARMHTTRLDPTYQLQANYIETLGSGTPEAKEMFDHLANSESHAKHLFGLTPFFEQQQYFGIAYGTGNNNFYHVIYIAHLV